MKSWIKHKIPDSRALTANRYLALFGRLLHDPNIWHLNRRSAAGGAAVGLFVMYIPIVGQMLIAAAGAVVLRVNLPIAVAMAWVSNPLTTPFMLYCAYVTGCWMLAVSPAALEVTFWADWHNWDDIIAPLGIGILMCAVVCALIGYFGLQVAWALMLKRQIRKRQARHARM